MRVAHFCENFSPLSETFIYDYVTELEQHDTENWMVTFNRVNASSRPFAKAHELSSPGRWNPKRLARRLLASVGIGGKPHMAAWPLLRQQLKRKIDQVKADVLHAHFGPAGVFAAPVARAADVPLVVSFHGFDAYQLPNDDFWKPKLIAVLQSADCITAVSNTMKAHLTEMSGTAAPIEVVRVGKRVADYPFEPRSERDVRRWISIGRLAEKKGHLDTLKAFRKVTGHDSEVSLTIIGKGPLHQEIQQFIDQNHMQKQVELLGAVPHDAVKEKLSEADAFVLCSKTAQSGDREGVPTVLMEAQAMGLPCVSTRHSGIPEVIPESNQFLLAGEGDIDEITDRMDRLMRSTPQERREIARSGRKKIEEEFNLEHEAGHLINLYADLADPDDTKRREKKTAHRPQ
jgi:glycosyltransferase involved in cell wall biosynthesis